MPVAIVKSVLSSDTVVLRNKGAATLEKVLRLEGIQSPGRIGSRDRAEEQWAFESREYLRTLVVGKEVEFRISHTVATSSPPLEFGTLTVAGSTEDVATLVVANGWARVREAPASANVSEEAEARAEVLRNAAAEAVAAKKGINGKEVKREVDFNMPTDTQAFLEQYKGKPLDAVVEGVLNGSTLRVRLLLSPKEHKVIPLGLAGIRAPRAKSLNPSASGEGADGEEFGEESRFFVESRLLQRNVRVMLLSLTSPTAGAGQFIGLLKHPVAGNVAPLIVAAGLASVVDWHASFLSQSPAPNSMAELRKAESEAKVGHKGIWRDAVAPTNGAANGASSKFQATVVRVWAADSVSIVKNGETAEKRVQLSSIRAPRVADPKLAGLQTEGKELLRKRLVGKTVSVILDYVKPAEGDYEARDCVTIKGASGSNVADTLLERGLVSLIRHRQGDDQRSSDYDRLMGVEAKAQAEKKGMHSGKDFPAPRIVDASESSTKAAPFLSSFKRSGRIPAVVDFVASGSRFKLFVPKQDIKLTLVLGAIRAPRTARNASEKSEPYGQEAATFASRALLQRDVEFSVDSADKSGGFIGKIFLGKDDFALTLVKEGLAKADDYAYERKDLFAAQEEAQKAKKNLWSSYEEVEEVPLQVNGNGKTESEYVDAVVSDVRGGGDTPFSFALQVLTKGGSIPELEDLMENLHVHHQATGTIPDGFIPRAGDIVSAKFTADENWYRAKIRKYNPSSKVAEVLYIDYGNGESVPLTRLRPLAPQFKSLPGQAKEASLSFVSLLGKETEYADDAVERFRELAEGRKLVAKIDARERDLLHVSLFDPADPASLQSPTASINVQLVADGLARIDTKSKLRATNPAVVKGLEEAYREAKRTRAGAFELGDILDD